MAPLTLAVSLAFACSKPEDHAVLPPAIPPAAPPASPPASAAGLAPGVTFVLADGFRLSLASLKGKVVAVVFCPAIDAPGCTRESHGLTRRWRELEEHHVTAVGVVPADTAQYRAAVERQDTPFDFVADVDGQLSHAFRVSMHDADPTLFLVGRDGTIRAVWRTADPDTHARELIAAAQR